MNDPTRTTDMIRLSFPAQAEYAHLARLTASSIAARFDFAYDDVEDVRIAVGELCGVLVDDATDSRIELTCLIVDDCLDVEGQRVPPGAPIELDDLNRQILEAVTDELHVHDQGAGLTLRKFRRG